MQRKSDAGAPSRKDANAAPGPRADINGGHRGGTQVGAGPEMGGGRENSDVLQGRGGGAGGGMAMARPARAHRARFAALPGAPLSRSLISGAVSLIRVISYDPVRRCRGIQLGQGGYVN